jgi:hypothetical protein
MRGMPEEWVACGKGGGKWRRMSEDVGTAEWNSEEERSRCMGI